MEKTQAQAPCRDTVLSLPPIGCQRILVPNDVLDSPTSNNFTLELTDNTGATVFNNWVGANYLNQTLNAEIFDASNASVCSAVVTIRDLSPALMACQDTAVACTSPLDTAHLGTPILRDDCSAMPPQLTGFSELMVDQDCNTPYVKSLLRTFTSMDASGNPGFCVQRIDILRPSLTEVEFPSNDTLTCGTVADTSLTGVPTIAGYHPITPLCNMLVAFEDRDTIFTCSRTEFTFKRRWTVTEFCDGMSRVFDQNITYRDSMPPVLTCIPPVIFPTAADKCAADIQALPDLSQLLQKPICVDTFEVHFSWPFGFDSVGPYYDVPAGIYDLTYFYSDCAGSDTCTTQIVVEDQSSPIALCKSRTINLNADTIWALAQFFDGGSFDNCAPLRYQVRRPGKPFGSTVGFSCADVGQTIPIILRVREIGNNSSFNTCTTTATIRDPFAPALVCPNNVTVGCTEDYTNPNLYGQLVADDNCGIQSTSLDIDEQVTACGEGKVIRTFFAEDIHGNISSCKQTIFVQNPDLFDGSSITWPQNYTANYGVDTHPDSLPAPYSKPSWPFAFCSQVAVAHQDENIIVASPSCYRILRHWTVVDWCQYDVNNPTGGGRWQYTQIIEINDPNDPILSVPNDVTVSPTAGCAAPYVALPDATATDENPNLIITNNSPYADAGFENASGTYPAGTHSVTFRVTDGCGNIAVKTMKITVRDDAAPSPICKNGISGNLTDTHLGYILDIPARLFDGGSTDNCTPSESLDFKVRLDGDTLPPTPRITFDCATKGFQPVEIFVTDLRGNTAVCETYIIVQDNMQMCPPDSTQTLRLGGCVMTDKGQRVQDVEMHISNISNFVPLMTNQAGEYSWENLPYSGDYSVAPYNNDFPTNGVNTYDILRIQKHLLGNDAIVSPYDLIAADVNNSGSVTPSDITELRKLILGLYDEFPDNDSWRFVYGHYQFPNPANPWTEPFLEIKDIQNLDHDAPNINFYAVKIGDVDGSAKTNLQNQSTDRNGLKTLELVLENEEMTAGEDYVFPVHIKDKAALSGLQLTLGFDKNIVEIEGLERGNLNNIELNPLFLREGRLPMLWTAENPTALASEDALFYVKLKAKKDVRLADALFLDIAPTPALAVSDAEEKMEIALRFEGENHHEVLNGNALLGVFPNPFSEATNLRVQFAENTEAMLEIFDQTGRLVFLDKKRFAAGQSDWLLKGTVLNNSGVYSYRISTEGWNVSGRLVKR